MNKKLVGLLMAVVLALVGLGAKITYINVVQGADYSRIVLSQAQQRYESRVIPYRRGDIQDRNGTILATSEKVYNIILDCKVTNYEETDNRGKKVQRYYEPTINALTKVLGISKSTVTNLLKSEKTKNSQYQILKKDVSITEKQKFEAYLDLDSDENKSLSKEERLERSRVKGVWFEDSYKRVYPFKSMASDAIGFTYSADNTADYGLEGYYSDVLNGVNGRQYGYFNADDDVEQTIVQPQNGKNITQRWIRMFSRSFGRRLKISMQG